MKKLLFAGAIAVLYLYNFPYQFSVMANERPRLYTAMALYERGSLDIAPELVAFGWSPDIVDLGGRTLSNKAPGASLAALPVYAALRLLGRPSLTTAFYFARLFVVTLPCLLLLVPFARFLRGVAPEEGAWRAAVAGAALGTLALPYSVVLMGHQVSAALVAAAWARLAEDRPRAPLLAGALCGAAVVFDYQAALAGAGLFALAAARRGGVRRALAFVLGAAPFALLLCGYHTVAFGRPWRTAYDFAPPVVVDLELSFWPQWGKFRHAFLAPHHGLLAFSPWLALALPGLAIFWRRRRADALLCVAMIAAYAWLGSSRAPWATNWNVGPRYLACMVPFLAAPAAAAIAYAWRSPLRAVALGLLAASIVLHVLVVAVLPYYPPSYTNPFYDLTWAYLWAGRVAYNAGWLAGLRGLASVVPYLAVAAALLGWLLLSRPRALRAAAAAVALAALHLGGLALVERAGDPETKANLELNWEP